jgi:hypothetical protein
MKPQIQYLLVFPFELFERQPTQFLTTEFEIDDQGLKERKGAVA